MKSKQPRQRFEFRSPCLFSMTVSTTLYIYIYIYTYHENTRVVNEGVQSSISMIENATVQSNYINRVKVCEVGEGLVPLLYSHVPYHNDSIIVKTDAHRKTHEGRTHEDFFRKIFTSHFIARVRKGC